MNGWKMMLSVIVVTTMLAGCGAKEQQSQPNQQAGDLQNGGEFPQRGMGAAADLMGKVKSIDGQTITLYKSAMNMNRGNRGTEGGAGKKPEGSELPDGGVPSQTQGEGEMPADGVPPQAPEGDGAAPSGRSPMSMEDMFTDETVQIQVTESTKILSITFENEKRAEKVIALSELKADDILSVTLKDDTQEAVTITLSTGGFGGGGGRQQRQKQQ